MKRYDYIFTFFLTAVFLFSSCSEEPFSSDNGVNLPSDGLLRLPIGVDDYVDENGAESRAEDSGAEFSFESGDRVGILVFSNTRQPREGEKDGEDYFFVSREYFQQMIEEGRLVEYAQYVNLSLIHI